MKMPHDMQGRPTNDLRIRLQTATKQGRIVGHVIDRDPDTQAVIVLVTDTYGSVHELRTIAAANTWLDGLFAQPPVSVTQ